MINRSPQFSCFQVVDVGQNDADTKMQVSELKSNVDESLMTVAQLETHILSMKNSQAMQNLKKTFAHLMGKQAVLAIQIWRNNAEKAEYDDLTVPLHLKRGFVPLSSLEKAQLIEGFAAALTVIAPYFTIPAPAFAPHFD